MKQTVKVEMNKPVKWIPGMRVFGIRKPTREAGILIRTYVTINTNLSGTFRNPAYVVLCNRDGKFRVFQRLEKR